MMRLFVPVTAFVQNCRPRCSDVNTKGSDTLVGRLRKLGCIRRLFIYLSIFFLFFFNFFIYLFIYFFFVRVSLECKDVDD